VQCRNGYCCSHTSQRGGRDIIHSNALLIHRSLVQSPISRPSVRPIPAQQSNSTLDSLATRRRRSWHWNVILQRPAGSYQAPEKDQSISSSRNAETKRRCTAASCLGRMHGHKRHMVASFCTFSSVRKPAAASPPFNIQTIQVRFRLRASRTSVIRARFVTPIAAPKDSTRRGQRRRRWQSRDPTSSSS